MLVLEAALTVIDGTLYTFTVTGVATELHPFASVIVRPTWPELLWVILCVVAPVLQE